MSKCTKRVAVPSESSDGSTDDLILKDDDMSSPNGLLTTEPYFNVVVEAPRRGAKSFSPLNKFLLLIVFFLFITTVIFVCLYIHEYHLNKSRRHQKYCTTAECVEAAAFMKAAMEKDSNPCDDFYQYACGGWLMKNPIPDGKSKWSIDSVLADANLNTMKAILTNMSLHNDTIFHSVAIHNTLVFYRACNNMTSVEKHGVKPLMEIIGRVGGFDHSFAGDKDEKIKHSKLQTLIRNMQRVTLTSPFFSASITIDDKDSSKYVIKFSQGGLGLELFRYKKNHTKVIQAYIGFLTDVGLKLNPNNISAETMRKMAEETYKFEKKLSEIFVPPDEMTTVAQIYHMSSVKALQDISASVNWLQYLQTMFSGTGIKIDDTEPILIYTLNYFKKLDKVLSTVPLRVIQNYIMFNVAYQYIDMLTEDFFLLEKKLSIAKNGVYKELPRWKRCISKTDNGLGMAIGALFVKKTFARNSHGEANDLVEAVRKAFIGMFPILEWMDAKTAAAAKEKAKTIIQKIGYPKFIIDNDKLDAYYKGFTSEENEYFVNQQRVNKFHHTKRLRRLREKVDQNVWFMTPLTINAYYNPSGNQIVFPAGILQAPFFKAGYPKAVNFGSMGTVIGHEITHGFDNNGRMYDAHGNYRDKGDSWWTNSSISGFKARTKCFRDQYSSFTVAGLKINGNVTLGENIADNGGLKASYKAYKNWVKDHGEELLLPGMDHSNDEAFFIAFGQSWCTGELNKRLIGLLETDVHSPFKERVKGSVQNSPDFAKIFKCPVGSPMNPAKKCSIW